jgi:hypothetical protein
LTQQKRRHRTTSSRHFNLFPELNVQLLASIPNGLWIEDTGLSNDLFVDPAPVIDGMITAPERPGHGLAFRPEILRDCRVADQALLRICGGGLTASPPCLFFS